jgi:hypothetical protein
MRLDTVVKDMEKSVRQLLLAMSNRLTATENFAPEGDEGQPLLSNGSNTPPSYRSGASGTFDTKDGKTVIVTRGIITSII